MPRAAVIGVGYLGQYHAEKYNKSSEAELLALVDIDEARTAKLAKKFKCRALNDYRELLELEVDCVSIASDTSTHYEIAKWCLENGIDVLVEKPMTVSIKEAEELIDLADKKDRILQVGHLERFNPAFKEVKKFLYSPKFFEVRRIAPFAGRGHDVDVVLDLMIHDIDIISHLVSRPLVKVEAIGVPILTSSVDIANARLTFEGGAIANVTASRASVKSERTLRAFQRDLYVSLDFGKKKLKIYKKSPGEVFGKYPNVDVQEHKVQEADALADEIAAFLDSVVSRKPAVVGGRDGLEALKLVQRIRLAFDESLSLMQDLPSSVQASVNE